MPTIYRERLSILIARTIRLVYLSPALKLANIAFDVRIFIFYELNIGWKSKQIDISVRGIANFSNGHWSIRMD